MASKMLYKDKVKYLIDNYKEETINVASDCVFGNGYRICLLVSRQST